MRNLNGLEVSQCYFIGEKNSTRLQSGLWTHGAGIHVDHCVFYGCRNAMGTHQIHQRFFAHQFHNLRSIRIRNMVWAAIHCSPVHLLKTILLPIVTLFGCGQRIHNLAYTFSNSLITENDNYMGYIADDLIPAPKK